MKSVVTSVILIAAVLWGSGIYTSKLTEVSQELIRINEEVQENLEKNDFVSANARINEMSQYLGEKEQILAAMGNHEEIDKIRMNLSELRRYANDEMCTDALAKSEVLEFLYGHLPVNYKLKTENIL